MLMATAAISILALLDERPSLEEILTWIDIETLTLLFAMMIMVPQYKAHIFSAPLTLSQSGLDTIGNWRLQLPWLLVLQGDQGQCLAIVDPVVLPHGRHFRRSGQCHHNPPDDPRDHSTLRGNLRRSRAGSHRQRNLFQHWRRRHRHR